MPTFDIFKTIFSKLFVIRNELLKAKDCFFMYFQNQTVQTIYQIWKILINFISGYSELKTITSKQNI